MAIRRPHKLQDDSFAFSPANKEWAMKEIEKYPKGRHQSAILALLWQAQKQAGGWLPLKAIEYVAQFLDMPKMRALEVASFYTMFHLKPVGEHLVQICQTTPCWLRGSNDLKDFCQKEIGSEKQVSKDGKCSWMAVECLGACVNAPVVQINDDFYEDITPKQLKYVLDELKAGHKPKIGSQIGRMGSAPISAKKNNLKENNLKDRNLEERNV